MAYNFDQLISRRNSDSGKWSHYDEDVLPMWVADMDFQAPQAVLQALHDRVDHGVFGYSRPQPELYDVICDRLARLYNWEVTPDEIVLMPGVISSFNAACRTAGQPGEGILMQTPVYYPFLTAPDNNGMVAHTMELTLVKQGQTHYYEIDYDAFEAAITPQTCLFLLCSPHNPVGRSFTRQELTRMAEICVRHNVLICSDEIHCDLMMGDYQHLPTAAISPEISDRCITLMAPSKTYNIPGLGFSFAVIQNEALREKFERVTKGVVAHPNLLGKVAALAAYKDGNGWLEAVLKYLTANRDFLAEYVNDCLPGIQTNTPEATYLAWLDCREAGIEGDLHDFFLEKARVGLSRGAQFGPGGEGFVRLNYGCPRQTLVEGLARMRTALLVDNG